MTVGHHRFENKLRDVVTTERFKSLRILCEERPTEKPSKDTIRHLVHRPEPTNTQFCFANVVLPHMIGYAIGYANVLRSCDFFVTPMFNTMHNPDPSKRKYFARDRQKCYWCLDHADMCNQRPYTIVDSGVFSLIAGSAAKRGKNKREDVYDYLKCYEAYIDDAFEPGVQLYTDNKPYFMDFDVQGLIGSEEARKINERLIKDHPNTHFIHTWHFEDGIKGLERMAKEYPFIAIGSDGNTENNYKKVVFAQLAKKFNPDVKIHVLGVADNKLLTELSGVATTVDCSGWNATLRFGPGAFLRYSRSMRGINDRYVKEYNKWLTYESGALELIRAYGPKLYPMWRSTDYTEEDAGWTFEKCQMIAWLMIDSFDYFNYTQEILGPQALFCKEDHKTPCAMFYKGMQKLMNWEKVTDADVEPGPYDICDFPVEQEDAKMSHEENGVIGKSYSCGRRTVIGTGPVGYQHITATDVLGLG